MKLLYYFTIAFCTDRSSLSEQLVLQILKTNLSISSKNNIKPSIQSLTSVLKFIVPTSGLIHKPVLAILVAADVAAAFACIAK